MTEVKPSHNRELKQRRRHRQRKVKTKSYVIWCASGSKIVLQLRMKRRRSVPKKEEKKICRRHPRSVHNAELGHFTSFFFLQWTAKKCAKIYNARAQLLSPSLNLSFGDALVAVIVLACLLKLPNCLACALVSRSSGMVL